MAILAVASKHRHLRHIGTVLWLTNEVYTISLKQRIGNSVKAIRHDLTKHHQENNDELHMNCGVAERLMSTLNALSRNDLSDVVTFEMRPGGKVSRVVESHKPPNEILEYSVYRSVRVGSYESRYA